MPSRSKLPTSTPTKPGFIQKISSFSVEDLFARKRRPPTPRSVYLDAPLPDEAYTTHARGLSGLFGKRGVHHEGKGKLGREWVFPSNQNITSKYTVITFLPRNLLEQFRRVANCFFLGIAILQFFPKFSTISPGLVILPLLVIVVLTAIKDGYEDIKRHQSDRRVNHGHTHVLVGPHHSHLLPNGLHQHHGEDEVPEGGYANHNHTEAKERTFVPGLPQGAQLGKLRFRKKQGKADTPALDPDVVAPRTAPNEKDGSARVGLIDGGGDQAQRGPHPKTPPIAAPGGGPGATNQMEEEEVVGEEDDEADEVGNRWKTTLWEDVRVGDFVKIYNNEAFPADLVICSTSEDESVCFVETKNLDGETNLKSRHAVPELTHLVDPASIARHARGLRLDAEAPDVNMFRLNAAVVNEQTGVKSPVDLGTMLLRGTVLRNTKWVVGIVLYTGMDTKIIMNSGVTPSKRSKTERQMDPQVFINLAILAVMCVFCAITGYFLERNAYKNGSYWTFWDDRSDDNPEINGLFTFFNGLITFQNIIPISLYISIEVVRTLQAAWIYLDKEIYYKPTGTRTMARSWNLSDDLGQIQYIFSDKTGTLTQNKMIFRECSVGGKVYRGDEQPLDEPSGGAPHQPVPDLSSDAPLKPTPSTSSTADSPPPATATDESAAPDQVVHFHDAQLLADLQAHDSPQSRALHGFFATLALCHTALASEHEDGSIEYKAQSPDEAALVQAAADVGFVFRGRDRNILRLQTPFSDVIEEFELLHVLEFTSARKRMSVIVRKLGPQSGSGSAEDGEEKDPEATDMVVDDEGQVFLLSKGADNIIFERCAQNEHNNDLKAQTDKDLELFANEGLRTLCLGYRTIDEEEYEQWSEAYHEASVALERREERMEEEADRLERNLNLLGATAIEDKLQDGVPETIADLKRAGIKVWVATGDKLETAIAIGYSTQLLARDHNLIIIRGGEFGQHNSAYAQMRAAMEQFFSEENIPERLRNQPPRLERHSATLVRTTSGVSDLVGEDNGQRQGGYALVIDGAALTHALGEPWSSDLLLNLALKCNAVICCRVSPLQKALIVRLIKDNLGVMTLAIGDGANDVSMIQAAHVGVGIAGEEGLQAVNSSDYSIAQFRFLKRLLLVHGHWSYMRNGNMIVNFFYKNIIGIGILFWFQFFCAYSTTYVFEYVYLLLWNVFWTLCPVIGIGLFDRDLDDHVLMALPELYRYGREGKYFGLKPFAIYMLEGIYQSVVVYFFIHYSYNVTTTRTDGWDIYLYEMSTVMVIAGVTQANLFNGLNTHAWTWYIVFAVFIGIFLVWAFTAVYSAIKPETFISNVYGNNMFLFHSAYFWFDVIFTVVVAMLPRYIFKAYKTIYHPNDVEVVAVVQKNDSQHDWEHYSQHDWEHDPALQGHAKSSFADEAEAEAERRRASSQYPPSRPSSQYGPRPSFHSNRLDRTTNQGSRMDMATGRTESGASRGFDFSYEEGGVAMSRLQSRLSEHSRNRTPHASSTDVSAPRRRPSRRRKGTLASIGGSVSGSISRFLPGRPRGDSSAKPPPEQ